MPKQKKLGECCELFALVIRRDVSREARRGFEVTSPIRLTTGKAMKPVIIYRFPKGSKDDPSESRDACYAVAPYCPFCGKKQEGT